MRARFLHPGAALFLAPLLVFLGLAYAIPFLGVVKWSFTLPEPGLGNTARCSPIRWCSPCSCAPSASAGW